MAYKYVLELFITLSFARQIKIFVATPRIYARVCSRREIYARVCSQWETSAQYDVATPIGVILR